MSRAIVTRYMGPTNHRPARVKASSWDGSVTVPWDHGLGADDNHIEAARALCIKFGWTGSLHFGGSPDCSGLVFLFEGSGKVGVP